MELEPIERIISGKGQIRIPSDYNSALQISLFADLLRDSSNPSTNRTWNPDKGFYAHITFCYEDYVLYTYDMNFKQQMWEVLSNQSSQNLLSLICAYDGILDSFVEIGNAVGFVISRTNLIKEHSYLRFTPNAIKFECFGESAIRLTLKGQALDKCNPADGSPTPPPPPPPPPPAEVSADTPIEVSEPYDFPGGDPDTAPYPTDDFPEEQPEYPIGEVCTPVRLIIRWSESFQGSPLESKSVEIVVLGEVQDVIFRPVANTPDNEIFVIHRAGTVENCLPENTETRVVASAAVISLDSVEVI